MHVEKTRGMFKWFLSFIFLWGIKQQYKSSKESYKFRFNSFINTFSLICYVLLVSFPRSTRTYITCGKGTIISRETLDFLVTYLQNNDVFRRVLIKWLSVFKFYGFIRFPDVKNTGFYPNTFSSDRFWDKNWI